MFMLASSFFCDIRKFKWTILLNFHMNYIKFIGFTFTINPFYDMFFPCSTMLFLRV